MNIKSLNKKLTLASVGILTASALLTFGNVGFALTGTSSSGAPTITINAYSMSQSSSNQIDGTSANDGSNLSGVTGYTAPNMANITFTAKEITPTTGETAADMVATNAATYTAGTVYTGTTASNGVASITTDATAGTDYYIVKQATTSGGITAMYAFIVSVPLSENYNVEVYPKQAETSSSSESLTVASGLDTTTVSSTSPVPGGQIVTWQINTAFDPSQTSTTTTANDGTDTYTVTNTLETVENLATTNDNASGLDVYYTITGGTGIGLPVALTYGSDYTVSTTSGSSTMTLTATGQAKVAAALAAAGTGTKATVQTEVSAVVPTTTTGAQYGDSFTANVVNAFSTALISNTNVVGSTAQTATSALSPTSTTPVVTNGAIDFTKTATDGTTAVAGEIFGLENTNGKYLATDGFFYTGTVNSSTGAITLTAGTGGNGDGTVLSATQTPSASPVAVTETTDANGKAIFSNLEVLSTATGTPTTLQTSPETLGYKLVETFAPSPNQVNATPLSWNAVINPSTSLAV